MEANDMMKSMKRITVLLLLFLFAASLVTPALAYSSNRRGIVPTVRLPDGIVGEPYDSGQIRPKWVPAATTWDIWEGVPPPPIWSVALYERGLDEWFSPDYSHSDPWDLPMIEESWYGTLPPGLFLDQFGGLIWGTPTQRGKYVIYASSFFPDGTQRHVPYHSITIRERLATPEIVIRAVRESILHWEAIPGANGYMLFVNGVCARTLGAVTSFDLEELNLAEGVSDHYINLIAVSTDELYIDSNSSNAERFTPYTPGLKVYGSPEHPRIHLSTADCSNVPQTSLHDITGSFVAMCVSILATMSLSLCVFLHFKKIRTQRG